MFPSNSYMDPYFSQNKEQVPYPFYPYFSHNKEQISYPSYPFYPYPVPSRPEPSAQPSSYGPWPNHFNPSHTNGYSYLPGYYGPRPPYPYEMPPPNFPNYYHPYFTPMANYPAKHPQLEHAEGQTHCCGCPNHVFHGTDSPRVKINEENPDVDLRKIPNNAYPFFWFPPRSKLNQDEVEKSKDKKKGTQFPWPIVWMPDDEIKDKKEKKEDAQFPWPIIWMPEDDAKETKDQNLTKRVSDEAVKPSFRIVPLKFLEQGDKDQTEKHKFPAVEENRDDNQLGKELREHGDKDQSEVRNIPVVEKKEVGEKVGKEQAFKERDIAGVKATENKHSKLPPVCLRLDPLPHKKPTNGSSNESKNKKEVKVVDNRSAKGEGKEKEVGAKEVLKDKLQERKMDSVKRTSNAGESNIKKEVKVVDVKAKEVLKDKLQERKMDSVKRTSNAGESNIKKEIKVVDVKSAEGKELKENEKDLKELEERKVENSKRVKMSEQDAAVLIQSVYRGYNVRRWDTLKKLKKIREVCEKAQELQGKLRHVEESAAQLEKKERLILSESIMNLLLQLDTIQGLHPTVREARKSVARELVSLQEKLDLLEKQKPVEVTTNAVQNAVAAPTDEVQQPRQQQLEVQPTATAISSEECKSDSELVEARTGEHMMTQKEDENSRKSGCADTLDLPRLVTDYHPVEKTLPKHEEDASITTEKSQVALLLHESEPVNLVPVNNAGENNLNAQSVSPQTCSVPGTENVQLYAKVAPSVVIESNTADHAPAVTFAKSSNEPSIVLSDPDVHDTDVASTVTEEIHGAEVSSGVAVTEGIKPETIIPETKNLYESGDVEGVLIHATESDTKDAQEIAPESNTKDALEIASEVTLCESASKDVDLQATEVTPEESHGSNAGASVENFESQAIEVGMPNNEEKVEANEITPELIPEESHGNDPGASVENVEMQAIEVVMPNDKENKVEDNEVSLDAAATAFPEEVKVEAPEVLREKCAVNDGDASAENVELLATEADKLEESKSVEENELTLPENKISDGYQNVEQVNEFQVELPLNFSDAREVSPEGKATGGATEGVKLSSEEKKLMELSSEEKKLMEENEKLRSMLEKLLEAGRNQLDVISGLNERVKGLEKRLEKKSKKSKARVMKHKPVMASPIKS